MQGKKKRFSSPAYPDNTDYGKYSPAKNCKKDTNFSQPIKPPRMMQIICKNAIAQFQNINYSLKHETVTNPQSKSPYLNFPGQVTVAIMHHAQTPPLTGREKSPVFTYMLAFLILFLFLQFRLDMLIPDFNALLTIFLSIFLEALPFILIGTLLSSVIEIFISPTFLQKIIPSNRFLALLMASFCGIVFPICECAIVPVTGRLVKKGVPVHVAITFLLAVPIVNPVVLLSTYYAFSGNFQFVVLRFLCGLGIALLSGFTISVLFKDTKNVLKEEPSACHHHTHDSCCPHGGEHTHTGAKSLPGKLLACLHHTTDEFFEVTRYMLSGAFLSALFQTYLPRNIINSIGGNPVLSIVIMMSLAYALSVCSESDAFIARTFLGQFTPGAVLSFIVFGPMLDIKNTMMLNHRFKRRFIILLILIISVYNFVFAILANLIL